MVTDGLDDEVTFRTMQPAICSLYQEKKEATAFVVAPHAATIINALSVSRKKPKRQDNASTYGDGLICGARVNHRCLSFHEVGTVIVTLERTEAMLLMS